LLCLDTEGLDWCATEVDAAGVMVNGQWGRCFDELTLTYSGTWTVNGHHCQFPFIMGEK